jgi:hypothetical protein
MGQQPWTSHPHVLVAGGDADPNVAAVVACLHKRAVAHEALLVGAHAHPRVTWDVAQDVLWINARASSPSALFLRYDVFTHVADGLLNLGVGPSSTRHPVREHRHRRRIRSGGACGQ